MSLYVWILCLKWEFSKYWYWRREVLELSGCFVSSDYPSRSVYFTYQRFYVRNYKTNACFVCTKESSRLDLSYKWSNYCCMELSGNSFTCNANLYSFACSLFCLYYRTKYWPSSFPLFVRLCLWLRSSTWRVEKSAFFPACISHWVKIKKHVINIY